MTTFLAGFNVGGKEICLFSFDAYEDLTLQNASEIGEAVGGLRVKVNEHPEKLWEVLEVRARLALALGPTIDVELERPLHLGVDHIIHSIRSATVPVISYFRRV